MIYHNNGGKKWWVCFRDPEHKGKFIRKCTGTEDWAKAKQVEAAVKLGIKGKLDILAMKGILKAVYGVSETETGIQLTEAWERYTEVQKQRGRETKEKTLRQIKKNLDDVIVWAQDKGLTFVRELTSQVALEYAEKLRKSGLKDKSRKNYIGNLSSVWRVLGGIEQGIGNPWANYSPTVKDAVRHGVFTVEQETAILNAARASADPTWATLCVIARHTGQRKGDIVHLTWEQIDLEKGTIRFEQSKTERYGISSTIPMVEELKREILNFKSQATKGGAGAAKGKLFPEFVRTYPNDPICTFKDILKAAKITDETLTFHSYRHTFRTRLAEAGAPDELAKRLGGWTQDKTLARYDHADKTEEIRAMIEKAANLRGAEPAIQDKARKQDKARRRK